MFDRKATALQEPSPSAGNEVPDSSRNDSAAPNATHSAEAQAREAGSSRGGAWGTEPKLGRKSPWLDSARFLIVWLPAVAMAFYVKWYTMTSLGGFSKATRSMGYLTLSFRRHLSFFNGEILLGFLVIPVVLLILNRYLGRWWAAIVTPLVSVAFVVLFAIQLGALKEVGRYISLHVIGIAIGYAILEPGATNYVSPRQIALLLFSLAIIAAAVTWSVKRYGHLYSDKTLRTARMAAELGVFAIVVVLASGWHTSEFQTPYHESTFARSVVSLWREKSVDTGEFADFNIDRLKQRDLKSLDSVSSPDLIDLYRGLVNAPVPQIDPRYFGKEQGDNVLFFVMETTPDDFLPADDDMSQFPNMRRLREHSFVGTQHYSTLPFTDHALFSVFSSWYPLDTLRSVRGFPASDVTPNFLYHLNSTGYDSAAFAPITGPNNPDEPVYAGVGFKNRYYFDPKSVLPALPALDGQPAWKKYRVGADLVTLKDLESHLDGWIGSHQKFVASFFPQIGHFPYPDVYPEDSEDDLRTRGRAIIAQQDAWLGELMDFLQQRGQLDHTIILVFGDHGRRNSHENPNIRRGTIDETSYHVPLLIYAPRTLDHTERIPWLTSHIDLVPTVLDLLGVKRDQSTEQGAPIWNSALAKRTTFFFGQPMFGADGYATDGKFFMWHYYSDMVYENSRAAFDDTNFIMRQSPAGRDVTSKISTMVDLSAAWQVRFAVPNSPDSSRAITAASH